MQKVFIALSKFMKVLECVNTLIYCSAHCEDTPAIFSPLDIHPTQETIRC